MKQFISILFLALCFNWSSAQIVAEPTIEFVKHKRGKIAVVKRHDEGQVAQTGWLKHNKPHGAWASFDEKGHITAQAQYERGVKVGTWRFWDTDGNLFCEIIYSNGRIVAAKQYDTSGSVVAVR